jgi:ankyrin repeat protein
MTNSPSSIPEDYLQATPALHDEWDRLFKDTNKHDPQDGNTVLHKAAWQGNLHLATHLISKGADLNAVNYNGETPLHLAAWAGHHTMVTLLLHKGSRPCAKERGGFTPKDFAISHGNAAIAELLSKAEAEASDLNTSSNHQPLPIPPRR